MKHTDFFAQTRAIKVHYSYASEICGMVGGWCDSTKWGTGIGPIKGTIRESTMTEHQKQEARYEKTFLIKENAHPAT